MSMVKRRKTLSATAKAQAAATAGKPLPAALYAPVIKAGLQTTTVRVQEMHHAIAGKTFEALDLVPGLRVPARMVRLVHDAITAGAYAAVRHGTGAMMNVAGGAERLWGRPGNELHPREQALRSALNGAAGDALHHAGSALAVPMSLHADGQPLPLTRAGLAGLGERVCLFIHGLACDEHSWAFFCDAWRGSPWEREGVNYGSMLREELGMSPLYLRYNTGLAIAENADRLAAQLSQLVSMAPPRLREIVLVGHSMGGLVARRACERTDSADAAWRPLVRTVVCLGSPHLGAPLEKLGHLVASALALSNVTEPLGHLANARSRGIQDLRRGLRGEPRTAQAPALRLVAGSLADDADAALGPTFGPMVGATLGDGLVTTTSAGDASLQGDVQRVELAGLGHMALLNHPRVYALLREWLAEPTVNAVRPG